MRAAIAALLVLSAGTACSGSNSYCQKLTAANDRLTAAQRDLFTGGAAGRTALPRIVNELRGVQSGAPAQIRRAISDLISAFQQAEDVLQHPSSNSQQRLARIATVLSVDGRKVGRYTASKCH